MKRSDIDDSLALSCIPLPGDMAAAPNGYQRLIDFGYPPKVVEAKLEHLARRGLITCGTSIRSPWLTDAGLDYIRTMLREAAGRGQS